MIPVLYNANETAFTTQGLGALTDTISCVVTEERNGAFELEMTYPVSGSLFSELKLNRLVFAVPAYRKDPEPFRIYKITKPLSGIVTVYAEHISYQLSFIPVSQYTATNAAAAVAGLKTHSLEQNPFTFWTDKTTTANFAVKVPVSCRSVLGGMAGSLLDVYGGEYEFNRYTVKLHNNRGRDRGVEIRYGKNLIDINQEENIANTITGVLGVYSSDEAVVSAGEVIYSANADNFPFKRTIAVDFSGDFDAPPSADDLKAKARSYIAREGIGVPSVSVDVDFIQLEQFEEFKNLAMLETVNLCDAVTVIFEEYGIDTTAKVIKTEWDALAEKYNKVSIGEARTNLSKTIQQVSAETIEAVQAEKSNLEKAIDTATSLITGAKGGNVVINRTADGNPFEILIMDTDNINIAQKVWRWNQNGLGFSSNGYQGPYETAMTADGHFVADFITGGTIDAEIVKVINLEARNVFVNASQSILDKFQDLQDQIDGTIDDYSTTETPVNTDEYRNYPSWDFTYNIPCDGTVALSDTLTFEYRKEWDKEHVGDLVYDRSNGLAYRFTYDSENDSYYWASLENTEMGSVIKRVYDLELTAAGLTSRASQIETDLTKTDSKITQTATQIRSEVASNYATKSGLASAQSSIQQNAAAITQKVSATDYNGQQVVSLINQAADSVQIQAKHVDLQGQVTFSDLDSSAQAKINGTATGSIPVYYRKTTSGAPSKPSAKVTSTATDTDNAWTLAMPLPKSGRYFYTCTMTTLAGGTVSFSAVTELTEATYASKWVSATDRTFIDGAKIYTGTVNGDKININDLFSKDITATNFKLIGGSVAIQTADGTTSYITLRKDANYYAALSSGRLIVSNSDNKHITQYEGGGFFTKNYETGRYVLSATNNGIIVYDAAGNTAAYLSSLGVRGNNMKSGAVYSLSVPANSWADVTVTFAKMPVVPVVMVTSTQSANNPIYGHLTYSVIATTDSSATIRAYNSSGTAMGAPFRWLAVAL